MFQKCLRVNTPFVLGCVASLSNFSRTKVKNIKKGYAGMSWAIVMHWLRGLVNGDATTVAPHQCRYPCYPWQRESATRVNQCTFTNKHPQYISATDHGQTTTTCFSINFPRSYWSVWTVWYWTISRLAWCITCVTDDSKFLPSQLLHAVALIRFSG